MKKYIGEDFLLDSGSAKALFDQAKDMPILDYHCHLPPKDIWENHQFEDITEAWLGKNGFGDHYKWRAMRTLGMPESLISGNGDSFEKFSAYSKAVSLAIGNPIGQWSHLELRRFFGIDDVLNPSSARKIYDEANEKLRSGKYNARDLITMANVYGVFTTDDPADSLEYHIKLREEGTFKTKVLPAFRPDRALNYEAPDYGEYLEKLGGAAGVKITDHDSLLEALDKRIDFFNEQGCRASDHAIDWANFDEKKMDILKHIARKYHSLGWAMEIHIGALRNVNSRVFAKMGPDTGYDAVHDADFAPRLAGLLAELDNEGKLPKTILFNLNPGDFYTLATIMAGFQTEECAGKMQLGTAWWFLDQRDGMEAQMKALANLGVMSTFIGMLTDSRSLLSYPRHELFRRILCNLFGTWVEQGEIPNDMELLGSIVKDISFNNAKNYFNV